VLNLIDERMLTRGDRNNRTYVGDSIEFNSNVSSQMQSALFDPQTAGGLLISLEEEKAEKLIENLPSAIMIGKVEPFRKSLIRVT
jgi:selenide,water dikinase